MAEAENNPLLGIVEVSLRSTSTEALETGVQPLLLDWGTFTFLSDQTLSQKAELYKNNHIKPVVVSRLWYKAEPKLGLLFSVP